MTTQGNRCKVCDTNIQPGETHVSTEPDCCRIYGFPNTTLVHQ